MRKIYAVMAVLAILVMALTSTGLVYAQTPAWGGTMDATITEPLVISYESVALPDGYQFDPVSLKVGEQLTYDFTVENTGSVSWLVKPTVYVPTQDLTAVWTDSSGVTIDGLASHVFTLTLTGDSVANNVIISIGFTRE